MKKLFIIAALYFMAASMAQAQPQSSKTFEARHQTIEKAEFSQERNYSEKPDFRQKVSDMDKLSKRNTQSCQERNDSQVAQKKQLTRELADQEYLNYRADKAVQQEYELGLKYYAILRLKEATAQKEDSERKLYELTLRQAREKEELRKKFAKALSDGRDYEKYSVELRKLEEKHAKQIAKAQKNFSKAMDVYENAVQGFVR